MIVDTRIAGVYGIRNAITRELYVGRSYDLLSRKRRHLNQLRAGRHCNFKLQESFNHHGESAFVFEILVLGDDSQEYDLIKKLKPAFNLGGPCVKGKPNMKNREHWRRRLAARKQFA